MATNGLFGYGYSMTETELKLEVGASDAEALLRSRFLRNAASEDLLSVYFETDGQDLREAGFSLRVRHIGDRRIQTIKADGPAAAGLFVRAEWEQDIVGDTPIVDADEQPLKHHVGDKVLAGIRPAFRSSIRRSTITSKGRNATIELVFDRGEISAGDRRSAVCELELELRKGLPAALFALARRIDKTVPVRLGVLSKSERGYRLLADAVRRATKSEPVALNPDMTAAEAFQTIAGACIRQFRLNEMVLGETDDPSALHQARVGLRRLRSALSLFRPMLAGDRFEHLRGELRWVAATLGEARNIDVLVARSSDAGVLAQLHQGRAHAYAEVGEALASSRLRHMMLDLAEWLSLGEWLTNPDGAALRDQGVLEIAATTLDKHRRRVKRRGKGLVVMDNEQRHQLRIETKKLRYAAEFFAPLYTRKKELRRTKLFRHAVDALQEQLGELNDIATIPSVLERLGIAEAEQRALSVPDTRKRKILQDAEEAFEAMTDARRFWR